MSKGMIIQCGGCGDLKYIDLDKNEDEIEKQIDDAVTEEGWRYTHKWNGWICDSCRKGGVDPLYETFFGKPKAESKLTSYVEMRYQAEMQRAQFKILDNIL